jgi:hypothetical protein
MTLDRRLSKLEGKRAAEVDPEHEAYAERWQSAYLEIISTMRADHFATVQAALVAYSQQGGVSDYIEPMLGARVYKLCTRAAQGFHAVLRMPPELAEIWNTFERDYGIKYIYERKAAVNSVDECEDCGATFPRLRPRVWDYRTQTYTGESRDYVTACLLCGGRVGFYLYTKKQAA